MDTSISTTGRTQNRTPDDPAAERTLPDPNLPDPALVDLLIDDHARRVRPGLETLWAYYRNPLEPNPATGAASRGRWYRLVQERGLPDRITGRAAHPGLDDRHAGKREVVVENDIGWRIGAMVDFLCGRAVRITGDDEHADAERILDAAWTASGGLGLIQDIALLGHVYGHVDIAVRIDEQQLNASAGQDPARAAADAIRFEPIEPTRGVPIISADDYRELDGYVIHTERELNEIAGKPRAASSRVSRLFGGRTPRTGPSHPRRRRGTLTEVFGPGVFERREDGEVIERRTSTLLPDVVPVVHIQHGGQPFRYAGLSEVERLIPLQDELNTRLSDRANRVTLQSFRMYLAKGLDGFDAAGVGPGVVWSTDNPDASIQAFGGDAASPSEDAHIAEIREALDKASAVPPLAGGVVRARIGNLSSATALRVTLLSLLAKTERSRASYGRGIERASAFALRALASAGLIGESVAGAHLRVIWPEPLPVEAGEQLREAKSKVELGVSGERVLRELGYAGGDVGIQ